MVTLDAEQILLDYHIEIGAKLLRLKESIEKLAQQSFLDEFLRSLYLSDDPNEEVGDKSIELARQVAIYKEIKTVYDAVGIELSTLSDPQVSQRVKTTIAAIEKLTE